MARPNWPRVLLLASALAVPLGRPAAAQPAGSAPTLAQVERKYPRMSPVHIGKCDRSGDGFYTRAELACVQGI